MTCLNGKDRGGEVDSLQPYSLRLLVPILYCVAYSKAVEQAHAWILTRYQKGT